MNNILLIHIGRHKTGSTAIQALLYHNEVNLKEYGWCYPDLKKELPEIEGNRFTDIKNGELFYTDTKQIDEDSEKWNAIWDKILEHLKHKNVVISAEEFFMWDTDKFLAGAKRKYENIKVVVYLRRQDRAIESSWNQDVKDANGCCQTFGEYIKTNEAELEYCHYLEKLDSISNIVGKENLIVRVYEKNQLLKIKHGIASDFLSIIGIKPDWNKWTDISVQNLRMYGNHYMELKRVFNTLQFFDKDTQIEELWEYGAVFVALSHAFAKEEADEGYFTIEERKEFMQQFALENERIAREYLHRENGVLFYDNNMDYPVYDLHICSPFEEDLIRLFSIMIRREHKENQKLKKQNAINTSKILLFNMRGRKLLLFGAGAKCRLLLETINLPVTLIADNDKKKSGQMFDENIKIIWTEDIDCWADYFVVVTCEKTDEIEEQLQNLGLKREEDYVLAKDYLLYQ